MAAVEKSAVADGEFTEIFLAAKLRKSLKAWTLRERVCSVRADPHEYNASALPLDGIATCT
jgi:hypothetical protein